MVGEKKVSEKAEQEVGKFYTFLIFLFMFNFFLILTIFFGGAIYLEILPFEFLIFYIFLVVIALFFLPRIIYSFFYNKEKNSKISKNS